MPFSQESFKREADNVVTSKSLKAKYERVCKEYGIEVREWLLNPAASHLGHRALTCAQSSKTCQAQYPSIT